MKVKTLKTYYVSIYLFKINLNYFVKSTFLQIILLFVQTKQIYN